MSRCEPVYRPGAARLQRVTKPVLKAIGAALPKFHSRGIEAISAPMWWKRDRSFGKTLLHFFKTCFKNSTRINHCALLRCPCTELRASGPAMKIFLGFLARSFFNLSLDPNLSLHFHPIHHQRSVRIFLELATFGAGVIREENEAALIEILEQDNAGGRFLTCTGGQRHRVSVVNPSFNRGRKPGVKLFHRIGIEIGPAQSSTHA